MSETVIVALATFFATIDDPFDQSFSFGRCLCLKR